MIKPPMDQYTAVVSLDRIRWPGRMGKDYEPLHCLWLKYVEAIKWMKIHRNDTVETQGYCKFPRRRRAHKWAWAALRLQRRMNRLLARHPIPEKP